MADIADLKGRIKSLQSAIREKDIHDGLWWLKRNVVATESLLRETKAGLAVGKLRTHDNRDIADLAKELVKKWKGEVDRAKAAGSGSGPKDNKPTLQMQAVRRGSTASQQSPGPASPLTAAMRTAKTDGVPTNLLRDQVRDKCMQMLYDALAFDSGAPNNQLSSRALAIEDIVYAQHKQQTSQSYKTKIRSLYLNLKDKSNPGLRDSVVSGDLPASRLCTMTSQDMASEERKQADKKITEANFYNSLGSEEMAAETDAFQCGRCKQRKTRYRQQQTRSADEPMTTFVTCTNCGNKWKFS